MRVLLEARSAYSIGERLIADVVYFALERVERIGYRSAGRTDVLHFNVTFKLLKVNVDMYLERGSRGLAKASAQLGDELVRVAGIEEVNVARCAVENAKRE